MWSRKRGIPHKQSYASGDGEMSRKERELEGEIDIDQRSAAAASVVRFVRACLSLLPVVQVNVLGGERVFGHAFVLGVERAVSQRCTDDGWIYYWRFELLCKGYSLSVCLVSYITRAFKNHGRVSRT